jgi:lipoprotein signal peptidase
VTLFAAVAVAIDRVVAHDEGVYHHAKPPLIVIVALVLVGYVWHSRTRFTRMGRAGLTLCMAGAIANSACLVLDPSGVSDYIDVRVGDYLITFNIADIALLCGLAIIAGSVLSRRLAARKIVTESR